VAAEAEKAVPGSLFRIFCGAMREILLAPKKQEEV
jgi:hypothetical protein